MSRGEEFRRFIHTDRERYVVYVLWLVGFSQAAIARSLGLRKTQVAGIIDNSEYANRGGMADERRQHFLDELMAIRHDTFGGTIDGGALDKVGFKIRPLSGRQKKDRADG